MTGEIKKRIDQLFKASGDRVKDAVRRGPTGEVYDPAKRENVVSYTDSNVELLEGEYNRRDRLDWGAEIGDRKAVIKGDHAADTGSKLVYGGKTFEVIQVRKVEGIITTCQIR